MISSSLREYRALLGPVAVIVLVGAALLWSPFEPHGPPITAEESAATGDPWHDADWTIFESKVRWALDEGLDTLPTGPAMAALGRTFVGTAYVPQTLEVDGPERIVVNFRGLDCVTFVENVLAMTRFVRSGGGALLSDRPRAEARYASLLAELRYRGGALNGYPSRLHYFSDWIGDNARRDLLRDITPELGGVRDMEPVDFMTTHTDAYRQLADPANVARMREVEARLSALGRSYIPEDRISSVADRIQDGDIIAATSVVQGLDVAHTGLALRVDGSLRLMHAPLVGDSVQISEITLAARIERIDGQDGIIVARALER